MKVLTVVYFQRAWSETWSLYFAIPLMLSRFLHLKTGFPLAFKTRSVAGCSAGFFLAFNTRSVTGCSRHRFFCWFSSRIQNEICGWLVWLWNKFEAGYSYRSENEALHATVVDTASILCLIIVKTTVCTFSSSEKHQDLLRLSAVMISQSDSFGPIRDRKQF